MNGPSTYIKIQMKTKLKDKHFSFDSCPCGQNVAARKIFILIQDTYCEGADDEEED